MSSKEAKGISLFDDDDDDVLGDESPEEFDLNLEEKLNRSERKTSKLIELQSKFAHDSRFKIGEHFLDDDEDEQEAPKTEIEEEKSKNIAILEQVLGKRIHTSKPFDAVNEYRKKTAQTDSKGRHSVRQIGGPASTVFNSVLTPRFDPTKVESKIYEIEDHRKRPVNIDFDELDRRDAKKAKKGKKEATVDGKSSKAQTPKPVTQPLDCNLKENYYEVSSNLKDTLAGNEDFSLGAFLGLSAFEEPSKALKAVNEAATYEPISAEERKKLKKLHNPFKYDSSDDEDEGTVRRQKWNFDQAEDEGGYNEEEEDQYDDEAIQVKVTPSPPTLLSTFGGFFFTADDARLQQEHFYTRELIEAAQAKGKERSLAMMRALSFRKRAALKNVKSSEKFAKKRKILRQQRKGKRQRFFKRNTYSKSYISNRSTTSAKPSVPSAPV